MAKGQTLLLLPALFVLLSSLKISNGSSVSSSSQLHDRVHTASSSGIVNVPLGVLVPLTGFESGLDLAVVSLMAINDINRFLAANRLSDPTAKAAALSVAQAQAPLDLSFLNQPFTLTPLINDTQLSPTVGLLSALYQIQQMNVPGIVGDTGSAVCESIQLLAAVFNVPTVSFSCTSPDLSNRAIYPTFYRTVPSDDLQGSTLAWIVYSYGWSNVAIIATGDAYAEGISGTFQASASSLGINVLVRVIFDYGSTIVAAASAVLQVKNSGARVIVLCGVAQDMTNVLQTAIDQNMMNGKYVWIGPDGLFDLGIYGSLSQPAKGILATSPYAGLGLASYTKFQKMWANNTAENYPSIMPYISAYYSPPSAMFDRVPFEYAAQTYDAVLMYAVAINQILASQAGNGSISQISAELLNAQFSKADFNFTGVSGYISFSHGDRLANYELYNLDQQGNAFTALGVVSPTSAVSSAIISATVFYDGTNNIPSDQSEMSASPGAVAAMTALMAVESAWIVFCIGFTIYFRERPVIKASSPEFLLVICLGLLLGLAAVPLLALNSTSYCRSYPFILGVAYVIVFLSLFIKTYRVAYIFNRTKLKVVGHQVRTNRLLVYVAFAVSVELLYNIAWLVAAPDQLSKNSNNGSFYSVCGGGDNFSAWLIVSYTYKGAALVWGVVLAIRVRAVHSYFNESKYVISCIFILAFTAIIVPAAFYTSNDPTIRFVLECIWILVVCAYIPGVLFVPKVYTLMYEPDSTGVKANVSHAGDKGSGKGTGTGTGTGTSDSSIQGARGPALIPFDQIVAPGVCIKADMAVEMRAVMEALNRALDSNDLSMLQHSFYKGVKGAGLLPAARNALALSGSAGSPRNQTPTAAATTGTAANSAGKERDEKRKSAYSASPNSPRTANTLLQRGSVRASIPTINLARSTLARASSAGSIHDTSEQKTDQSAGSTASADSATVELVHAANNHSFTFAVIPEARSETFHIPVSGDSLSPSNKRRESGQSYTQSNTSSERTRPPAMNRI